MTHDEAVALLRREFDDSYVACFTEDCARMLEIADVLDRWAERWDVLREHFLECEESENAGAWFPNQFVTADTYGECASEVDRFDPRKHPDGPGSWVDSRSERRGVHVYPLPEVIERWAKAWDAARADLASKDPALAELLDVRDPRQQRRPNWRRFIRKAVEAITKEQPGSSPVVVPVPEEIWDRAIQEEGSDFFERRNREGKTLVYVRQEPCSEADFNIPR